MRENRGSWYLLTGLILGLVLGLGYAWVMRPVEYVDTSPATLRSDFKDKYRSLIAMAYVSNGDLVRARARLDLLQDPNLYRVLAEQAQRTLAEGQSPEEARALGMLAIALGQSPAQASAETPTVAIPVGDLPGITASPTPFATTVITPTLIFRASPTPTIEPTEIPPSPTEPQDTPTPEEGSPQPVNLSTPTRTANPAGTVRPAGSPAPNMTPSATPGGPFVLDRTEQVCSLQLAQPLIRIEALDGARQPVAGVEVVVTWEGGEEHFFTGLKPERGPGYADFTLRPGVRYTVRVGAGGQEIADLQAVQCTGGGGGTYWGALQLVFIQR